MRRKDSAVTLLQIWHLTRIKRVMVIHGRLQGETLEASIFRGLPSVIEDNFMFP